jgi:soluble lytic murein transglycosylase-like protein
MRGDTMPMDEFVEEVPFNQARGYVKKVLRFLHLYLTLYEGKDELYVGQNIRTDYRPHPKF